MPRIDLHLRLHLRPNHRDAFFAFLREAVPVYERPGGITMSLLQDFADDHRFIERVLYDDEAAYHRDQVRIAADPEVKALLVRWRALLRSPPIVEVYRLSAMPPCRP